MEWKPIDTAPLDRLVILACSDWPHSTLLGKDVPVKVGGFWDNRWNIFGARWKPTHWMELPDPPPADNKCPMCTEMIDVDERYCRNCGEFV